MFGLAFILVFVLGVVGLFWATKLFSTWKTKAAFLFTVLGGLAFYPFAYRFSPSYANFLALCELPDRYQVVRTKHVEYIFLDRDAGADCTAGPSVIGTLAYAGFDCIAPDTRTTTAVFRYMKKPNWRVGCGLECFDSSAISVPEHRYKSGHRQGYISGATVTVTYDNGLMGAEEPSGAKLRFSDTLLIETGTEKTSMLSDIRKLQQLGGRSDADTEMAFTRAYTYYPFGNGWAKLLGAASGSAPSMHCSNPYIRWNLLDVYKPLGSNNSAHTDTQQQNAAARQLLRAGGLQR
ncbi:MAG: hypothetical protein A3F78_09590 [Burkholderiales bacterium RIFCSPLOWO2_12_FULL_61_40]|nr:MAG: hypothetical protein A3F78_09590 [Burkholderiales bacterium RIFCSPLOWO2_12_FULL_61_40]